MTATPIAERDVILVEDAHLRPMMGLQVLEPVPARNVPYDLSDPFILVHEAIVPIDPERAKLDTTHPHRGGGSFDASIPAGFHAFVWMLEGEASVGANRRIARRSQIALLGPEGGLGVTDALPGTRFMLMAGQPYGEEPIYNGPYVD